MMCKVLKAIRLALFEDPMKQLEPKFREIESVSDAIRRDAERGEDALWREKGGGHHHG